MGCGSKETIVVEWNHIIATMLMTQLQLCNKKDRQMGLSHYVIIIDFKREINGKVSKGVYKKDRQGLRIGPICNVNEYRGTRVNRQNVSKGVRHRTEK